MARSPNPYQINAGPYQGIGEGLANLGQLFLGGSDPARQAQAEQAAWAARESRENVTDTVDARTGRRGLGEQLAGFDPTGDNRQLFAQGVGTGAMDVDDLSSLFLAMQSNFGGTDEQVGRAFIPATGSAIGTGDGFSLGDREGIAGRDQSNAMQIQAAQDAAAMARTQVQQAGQDRRNRYTVDNDPRRSDGLGSLFDPLDATRLSTLESDAEEALNNFATDAGVDASVIPPDLRTWVLGNAVQGLREGRYRSPRAAVGDLWQQTVQGVEETPWYRRGGPSLNYDIPAAMTPATPARPQAQGNMPVVRSDADFDALPSGTEFVDEDGNAFRKP